MSEPVLARSSDEVGEIVAGFNDLVASIRERECALEDSSRQLRESNVALHNEVRERRSAETELLHSREFLEVAQAAGGIGVFDLDLESRQMLGSGSFFTLQGIDPRVGAITQDQWLALVHPDDLEPLIGAFTHAVEIGWRVPHRVPDQAARPVGALGQQRGACHLRSGRRAAASSAR